MSNENSNPDLIPLNDNLDANNPELLAAKLSLETAKIPWRELEVHFARGVVRQVKKLDLPQVGMELINNNAKQIEKWIASGKLGEVKPKAANKWHKNDELVWALVVAPWVLVQEIQILGASNFLSSVPAAPPPVPPYNPPTEPWLNILYQDEHLLVVDKPAGLLSTPGKEPELYDSLYSRALSISPFAQLVHRLDMATSGLVIIALQKQAEAHLKKQFEQRKVQKTYLARVWGKPDIASGEINLPLICDWPNRPKQKVCYERGKPALTLYKLLSSEMLADISGKEQLTSLVELTPITGRSHQLRVHMQALGCPIVGDRFYAPMEAQKISNRLLLQAAGLGFQHPVTEKEMGFNLKPEFQP